MAKTKSGFNTRRFYIVKSTVCSIQFIMIPFNRAGRLGHVLLYYGVYVSKLGFFYFLINF